MCGVSVVAISLSQLVEDVLRHERLESGLLWYWPPCFPPLHARESVLDHETRAEASVFDGPQTAGTSCLPVGALRRAVPFLIALPSRPLGLIHQRLGASAFVLEAAIGTASLPDRPVPTSRRRSSGTWLSPVTVAPRWEAPTRCLRLQGRDVVVDVLEIGDVELVAVVVLVVALVRVALRGLLVLLDCVDRHPLPRLQDLAGLVENHVPEFLV